MLGDARARTHKSLSKSRHAFLLGGVRETLKVKELVTKTLAVVPSSAGLHDCVEHAGSVPLTAP